MHIIPIYFILNFSHIPSINSLHFRLLPLSPHHRHDDDHIFSRIFFLPTPTTLHTQVKILFSYTLKKRKLFRVIICRDPSRSMQLMLSWSTLSLSLCLRKNIQLCIKSTNSFASFIISRLELHITLLTASSFCQSRKMCSLNISL